MSASSEFKLPDVGEGLTEAEIVTWYVKVGDTVKVNDTLVDIETAKSVVELPSPFAGVVEQILVEPGTTVEVGTPIIVIGSGTIQGAAPESPDTVTSSGADSVPAEVPQAASTEDDEKPQVLVGPGPKEANVRRRRLSSASAVSPGPQNSPGDARVQNGWNLARTTPPVRLLARQLGVDLDEVALTVTGPITHSDVQRAAGSLALSLADTGGQASPAVDDRPVEDGGSTTGRETRMPVKGVRKVTAQAMTKSAFTAPHVTEWLTVDITPTMQMVRRLKSDTSWSGVRINPMLFVARAFLLAIRSFPAINASWDADAEEIVLKHYVNLGIAAATPRGLLVPNIKGADTKNLRELAAALADLVATARLGKTQPSDMAHGTVTITNIGALGVDAGTPILNPGESAILAFGAVRQQPWVVDGQIQVREVTQLAMSFDHRLVDGELGSHVLARTGAILADPGVTFLYA